jgi:hypothetical protein
MVKHGTEVKINTGDPWLQLIPMSEKPIEVKCQLVSDTEMNRLNTTNISSVGSYGKSIRNKKRQEGRLNEND